MMMQEFHGQVKQISTKSRGEPLSIPFAKYQFELEALLADSNHGLSSVAHGYQSEHTHGIEEYNIKQVTIYSAAKLIAPESSIGRLS